MRSTINETNSSVKGKIILLIIFGLLALILLRLFYWQIIKGSSLRDATRRQSQKAVILSGNRGQIYTSDGYLLVGNTTFYSLVAEKEKLPDKKSDLAEDLAPLTVDELYDYKQATDEAEREKITKNIEDNILTRLEKDSDWITLLKKIDTTTKEKIEQSIDEDILESFSFQPLQGRFYPEASMAAHLTGFLGKSKEGEDLGYFGIEGSLNKEMSPQSKRRLFNTDAFGLLLAGQDYEPTVPDGRDIVLTIRRDIQHAVENELIKGVEKYGAKSGEVIIMDPKTGKILALATWPHYDPAYYSHFNTANYKNPVISSTYEPGSTFKTLTIAAGIDSGAIKPDTECDKCSGPRKIGSYTIRTWNNEYTPDIKMIDALAKSDNTAMIFVAESVGRDKFVEYIKSFGIGDPINIDLQGDTKTPFPKKWGDIELATTSFGQGISTTSLQLIRAIGAIANRGVMMRPSIVEKVIDKHNQKEIEIKPVIENTVISPESAETVTKMMIESSLHGEAQWTISKEYTVAGKTGTSQVAGKGGYEKDKTIASFIGFAPPQDPKFIMLVKLTEPSSSPWAAETAAPLWFQTASKVFLLMNIPKDK